QSLPSPCQLTDLAGLPARKIARLGAIVSQVIQLPRPLSSAGDKFQVSDTNRAVPLMLPPKRPALDRSIAGERRNEAHSGRWRGWSTLFRFESRHVYKVPNRRREIDHVTGIAT